MRRCPPPCRRAPRLLPPLLAAALLATPGCGRIAASDLARAALWPFGDLLLPRDDGAIPDREVDWSAEPQRAAPPSPEEGPALSLRLGGRRARALLIQEEGERRLWRSAGGLVVATDGARVVATAGLAERVTATRFDDPDPLEDPRALVGREQRARRTVDLARAGRGPSGMRFGLVLTCRLRGAALPEAGEEVLLIEERCSGDARAVNRFWADARTGAVFRSEQWIGEDTPPLAMEVVGPAPPER
ncbi:YjbF family lipoprotein [Caldovatus aquaticus]|uniref:YjbF family lipoprotein n=1 Tax=Caldovatus aquaticus TaxID=2865671 RepID=A0ABS7F7B3_9PROT|nr:YjbF family lipoprotein [Caldovatus aquaticus]MBW8271388.1 YjbF family lipoprotein [Caldovatus aquaticus]